MLQALTMINQAAAGGIGLGWYVSHNDPSHNVPKTIGGSAGEASTQATSSSSVKVVGSGTASVKTTLHVSPTNTVARRVFEPKYTSISAKHRRAPAPIH